MCKETCRKGNILAYINGNQSKAPKSRTVSDMRKLQRFLAANGTTEHAESLEPSRLDVLLAEFFKDLKRDDGSEKDNGRSDGKGCIEGRTGGSLCQSHRPKSAVKRLLDNGHAPQHVAQLTGHKNTDSLLAYTEADVEVQRKMAKTVLLQENVKPVTAKEQPAIGGQDGDVKRCTMSNPVFNNCVININVHGDTAVVD